MQTMMVTQVKDEPKAPLRAIHGLVLDADEHVLFARSRTHDADALLEEMVRRYNAVPALVELISTVIRETSPQSAPAFMRTADLPRIYAHLTQQMKALGFDIAIPGGPAVLEIPATPEPLDRGIVAKDTWATAWEAGYKAAWTNHLTPDKVGDRDADLVDDD
jgi:hypothetical protein